MSGPSWVPRARELYEELGSYAAVAREVGVTASSVRYQLDPDAKRKQSEQRRRWRQTPEGHAAIHQQEVKRAAKKEAFADSRRAPCTRCGRNRGPGSEWASRQGSGLCRKCVNEIRSGKAKAKRIRLEQLWKEGLSGAEIAAGLGITEGATRQLINEMRQSDDYDVPHRYNVEKRK